MTPLLGNQSKNSFFNIINRILDRFLLDNYEEITNSTHALIIYKYKYKTKEGTELNIDIWDTAGQEAFDNIHPTYYFEANAALLVFDTTRKITYKNCMKWYNEFRTHCPSTPCILVGNKIDIDKKCVERKYALGEKIGCPFYLTSAADGTNVVRIFEELIKLGVEHKMNPKKDYSEKILDLLDDDDLFDK